MVLPHKIEVSINGDTPKVGWFKIEYFTNPENESFILWRVQSKMNENWRKSQADLRVTPHDLQGGAPPRYKVVYKPW